MIEETKPENKAIVACIGLVFLCITVACIRYEIAFCRLQSKGDFLLFYKVKRGKR